MAKKAARFSVGKAIVLILCLALWGIALRYSNWYFYTGFTEPNAIMRYCAQFNDTALGWTQYVLGHGVLNFVAGYGAVFPLLLPIVLLILVIGKKPFYTALARIAKLFFTALFFVVLIVGILYSALFLMEQLPLVAGLLALLGICMLIPTGQTLIYIVVVD